ncbi:helix-turn-helix transcriptional regulator [Bacillus licheniformis]|nr:helix-turn-helix transcriptional regulator [Bacillus licheniformis]
MKRKHLINLREEKDWYQRDVVARLKEKHNLDITVSYYGMIETGKRTPRLELALAIADVFDVKPNDIFFAKQDNKKLFKSNIA